MKQNMTREEVDKRLVRIASGLPKIKRLNRKGRAIASMAVVKMRGHQLIAAGRNKIGGKPVDPQKFYRMRRPLVEHHYNNVKELYEKGGWHAVDLYVRSVWRAAFFQLPFKKKAQAIGRLFLNLFKRKTGREKLPA